jgi:DnaK suppressor protein
MEKKVLEEFKQLLLKERERLGIGAGKTNKELQLLEEDKPIESEEKATVESAVDLLAKLREQGSKDLKDIEDALDKIESGTYGICEECGKPISEARLKALPTARLCITCKGEREEREKISLLLPHRDKSTKKASLGEYTDISEEELTETILEQLEEDGRVDTSNLDIIFQGGKVFLTGTINSEDERQIILQIVTETMGLPDVEDNLEVTEAIYLDENADDQMDDISVNEEIEEEEDLELD